MAGTAQPVVQQPKYQPLAGPQNLNSQNINATAPAPYQQFGNIPQIDPSYYQAVNASPYAQKQYLSQYDKMYAAGLQPTFNQQDLALSQDLSSRGITDSSAASNTMGDLYAQQGGQIAQGEAPMVSQAFGYTQQDIMANQAAQNAANATNASASNAAAGANAGFYNSAVTGNENAYNAYQQSLFGAGTNQNNSLLSAYLNSFGPQTGVTNALGSELSGESSAYGDIYDAALQGQGQSESGVGQGLGSYFAAAAAAG
jgi:hypothetical protein